MAAMHVVRALSAAFLFALAGISASAQERVPTDLEALKATLLQLKLNPYPPPRERSAQILVAIIRRMDVSTIDKATIDEIAGLLEDNSDAVRARPAIALGKSGESAKSTWPALEKASVKAKDSSATSQPGAAPPSATGISGSAHRRTASASRSRSSRR